MEDQLQLDKFFVEVERLIEDDGIYARSMQAKGWDDLKKRGYNPEDTSDFENW